MNLPIPGVGNEQGPNYANDVNTSLTLIDQHTHTPGQGIQVPIAGISWNADVPLAGFNLTQARSLRLATQSATPALGSDLAELYSKGVDLYFIDGAGNNIRITQSGSVAGAAGTITGLPSGTASASYAAGVFTFQSATSTGANVDGASFVLRNNTANSKGLTLQPPNAMGADYSLTLPALPGSTSIMSLDSSGNMAASYTVDGSTIVISGGVIGVSSGGIGTTQLANSAVTTAKIADQAVTAAKITNATITQTQVATSFITSGTYTPIAVVIGGTCAVAPFVAQFMRVGNTVTVSGSLTIGADPNADEQVVFSLSLPIAASPGAVQACGVMTTQNNLAIGAGHIAPYGPISGSGTGNVNIVTRAGTSYGGFPYYYMFMYSL